MRGGYDSCDIEFATALAASAKAIHSIESQETGSRYPRKASTRRDEPFRPAKTVSLRQPPQRDNRTSFPSRLTPILSEHDFCRLRPILFEHEDLEETLIVRRNNANSGEEAQKIKIRNRYEKMFAEIQAWENEKKMKAKHRLQKQETELEMKKSRNMKHYQSKILRIDRLAAETTAKIEEKRRVQVSVAKEKASKMRTTGKVSVKYCFCF